jgi:ATP-dependent Clp protease adapter protein ClpS
VTKLKVIEHECAICGDKENRNEGIILAIHPCGKALCNHCVQECMEILTDEEDGDCK